MVRLYFLPYIQSIYNVVSSTVLNYITMFMLNIVFGISGFDAECFVSMLGDVLQYVCIVYMRRSRLRLYCVKLHNPIPALRCASYAILYRQRCLFFLMLNAQCSMHNFFCRGCYFFGFWGVPKGKQSKLLNCVDRWGITPTYPMFNA